MAAARSGGGGRALRAARRLTERRALRTRRPPAFRTTEVEGPPTVYYLCPDYAVPSGGIRAIYRHVDVLNRAGIEAAVLHHSTGFACRWFEHETRTLGVPSVALSPTDVVVVPEIYGPFLERLPRTPRLVAFNQNAYLTFEHVAPGSPPPYGIFAAALTVSADSAEYLRFAFPGLAVSTVPNGIDPAIFRPLPEPPPRRLALMPRKRSEEAEEILRLLGERLHGWEVVRIEGASEAEAAAALRSAPIFLALGRREGFGLPVAEAMASGCLTIGFPAFGGRELFDPADSIAVEDGDVLAAARALAEAMERYELDPASVRAQGTRAAGRIAREYTLQRQSKALLAFYAGLGLRSPTGAGSIPLSSSI
jgi:glycosyltransferase involved in cell wall biosynthesis